MKKTWIVLPLTVLLLAGCAAAGADVAQLADGAAERSSDTASAAPADGEAVAADYYEGVPTGDGEVCDIKSLYTVECHKQFPEVAYLNGITRLGGEPLISLSDDEKIALGYEACDQVRSGVMREEVSVVEGVANIEGGSITNSSIVAGVAIPSFCSDLDDSGLYD